MSGCLPAKRLSPGLFCKRLSLGGSVKGLVLQALKGLFCKRLSRLILQSPSARASTCVDSQIDAGLLSWVPRSHSCVDSQIDAGLLLGVP